MNKPRLVTLVTVATFEANPVTLAVASSPVMNVPSVIYPETTLPTTLVTINLAVEAVPTRVLPT